MSKKSKATAPQAESVLESTPSPADAMYEEHLDATPALIKMYAKVYPKSERGTTQGVRVERDWKLVADEKEILIGTHSSFKDFYGRLNQVTGYFKLADGTEVDCMADEGLFSKDESQRTVMTQGKLSTFGKADKIAKSIANLFNTDREAALSKYPFLVEGYVAPQRSTVVEETTEQYI